jgi:3-oxoacyl-[acyl-carrier-protein] synthase-3
MPQNACARIVGMASYLPEKILTNSELERLVETSDEWIISRTGISERRIAAAGQGSASLGAEAALKLLQEKGIDPSSIDMILVATMTPDYLAPSNAALIQANIQATNAAAVDFQAACTGFVYGLSLAKAYIESGMYKRVLLIATEKMSAFVDYTDRNTCVLFGDGASAALIEGEGSGLLIESVCLGADGSNPEIAWIPSGGSLHPTTTETIEKREHYFRMQGKELFRHAVRRMSAAAGACLARSNIQESDLSWIVPHQANARIIDAVAKSFSVDSSLVYRTVHKYGNTSASSVAIALDELIRENPLSNDALILLVAFGAGLTWGASVLRRTDS